MGVNCSQSVPVYVTQRCGSSWVVVDRCGIVVGRCGSLWDRCGSLWIVVGRCGSFRVLVATASEHVPGGGGGQSQVTIPFLQAGASSTCILV